MLNISENSINQFIKLKDFESYKLLRRNRVEGLLIRLIAAMMVGLLLCLFLPWTQNINAKGYVTTILPEQRPQGIQSVIAGRVEKWYVQEGSFVEKGDTIVYVSEVKSDYFDPNILDRTAEQLDAKSQSVAAYDQKIIALNSQYNALEEALVLKREQTQNKMEQTRNKIKMDSIDLVAYLTNLEIAKNQLSRTKELHDKGLKTLTALQEKEYKVQASEAKVNVQKNKITNKKNELANLKIELNVIERQYADKMAKSLSDKQSALSAKLESVAATAKLKSKLTNYDKRQSFYYITAPQSGYITKVLKKGIGEIVKAGTNIATIVPSNYDFAVELYVKPQSLPLLHIGDLIHMRFDGWPAVVISGWPESSTGVFQGEILVIDQYISENGKYRLLIKPREEEKPWPKKLSMGTGADAFILLKEVPIWYEVWRQLNAFPPDFYETKKNKEKEKVKRKAPLKSVK